MAANIEKIKTCFRALGSFLKNALTLRLPVWLLLVAFSVCVLLTFLVACNVTKGEGGRIDSAVVGYSEYHGHNYMVFYAAGSFSVVHDPDCICKVIE